MLVLKRREIVASALVVLIGVAGYLNWSYRDTIRVTDGAAYTESSKKLGEAQYVGSSVTAEADYFEEACRSKEEARSKAMDLLSQTASNQSYSEEARFEAQKKLVELADYIEKEAAVENILLAKDFGAVCAYYDGISATVAVRKDEFTERDAVCVRDAVMSHTNLPANAIRIIDK